MLGESLFEEALTIPLDEAFSRGLRQLTKDKGVLLICDEVITGFRCSPGGAQAAFGIVPDMTTVAKVKKNVHKMLRGLYTEKKSSPWKAHRK